MGLMASFNTASGKCCCNVEINPQKPWLCTVSIPQAVSAVATPKLLKMSVIEIDYVSIPQAVSAVATADSKKPVFMRFQKLILESLKP